MPSIVLSEQRVVRTGMPVRQYTLSSLVANPKVFRFAHAQTGISWIAICQGSYRGHIEPTLVEVAPAEVPEYSATDGMDIGLGRWMIEVGMRESQLAAYKEIKMIGIAYQPGASDAADDLPMDMDMICFILVGSFTLRKTGLDPYDVKEGDFYSCGIGKKDLLTNTGPGVGIHRIALLLPA